MSKRDEFSFSSEDDDIVNTERIQEAIFRYNRNYIEQSKKKKEDRKEEEDSPYLKFYNKKGVHLSVGDRVVLLTRGVDNDKGEDTCVSSTSQAGLSVKPVSFLQDFLLLNMIFIFRSTFTTIFLSKKNQPP